MVETLLASWIVVKCPLCCEHRRHLRTEVFQGRLSYVLIQEASEFCASGAR
jgi:predicted DCC family thiol-disulfide oxidoreductase YuxK